MTYISDMEKQARVELMSFDRKTCMKVRQVTSEKLSSRRRKACDHLFKELGYHCLLSSYVAHSEEKMVSKRSEVLEAWSKLLKRRNEGHISTINWITADDTNLYKQDMESSVRICNSEAAEDYLQLFSRDIAIQVLHKFMSSMLVASLGILEDANVQCTESDVA